MNLLTLILGCSISCLIGVVGGYVLRVAQETES